MHDQYLWRKQASKGWLRANEMELLTRFAKRVAFIERPTRKRTGIEICCRTHQQATELTRDFGGTFNRIPRTLPLPRSKPLKVGARLVISDGGSRSLLAGRQHLTVPASGAFGTGEHATTAMCLRLIERATRQWSNDWSMLDAGTGSGILALAAKCFGADRVTAIDNDPKAIAIAKSNARANRIDCIRFQIADAVRPKDRENFDLIVANLFSELLVAALPNWLSRLSRSGFLILSGILRRQEREVTDALHRSKFAIEEIRRRGKWIAILARSQKAG